MKVLRRLQIFRTSTKLHSIYLTELSEPTKLTAEPNRTEFFLGFIRQISLTPKYPRNQSNRTDWPEVTEVAGLILLLTQALNKHSDIWIETQA